MPPELEVASNVGDLAFEVLLLFLDEAAEASRPPLLVVVDKVAHVVEVTAVLLKPFCGVRGDAAAVTTEVVEAAVTTLDEDGVVEAKSVESEAAEPRFKSLPPPTTLSVVEAEAPGTVIRPLRLLLRERSLRLFNDEVVEGLILLF